MVYHAEASVLNLSSHELSFYSVGSLVGLKVFVPEELVDEISDFSFLLVREF